MITRQSFYDDDDDDDDDDSALQNVSFKKC